MQATIQTISGDSIQAEFLRFHKANPRVYETLVRLCREAKAAGRTHLGIGQLWEVMRWELSMKTHEAPEFRLNNNYRSRYARWIMRHEPDLANVFETRELKHA